MGENDILLIIDDEEEICFLLGSLLKNFGFETDYAKTLAEGENKLKEIQPKIIFLDLNLPDGSGFTLVEKVNQISRDTRIIMITAHDTDEVRTKAQELGIDAFISKPFNKAMIEDALEAVDWQKAN